MLGWNDLLDKHGHEDLINPDAQLPGGEERSLIELARPGALDGRPRLIELVGWDTELKQGLLEESVVAVALNVRKAIDEFLELVEVFGHPVDVLRLRDLGRELIVLLLKAFVQTK
jgi:hypothetical protein